MPSLLIADFRLDHPNVFAPARWFPPHFWKAGAALSNLNPVRRQHSVPILLSLGPGPAGWLLFWRMELKILLTAGSPGEQWQEPTPSQEWRRYNGKSHSELARQEKSPERQCISPSRTGGMDGARRLSSFYLRTVLFCKERANDVMASSADGKMQSSLRRPLLNPFILTNRPHDNTNTAKS